MIESYADGLRECGATHAVGAGSSKSSPVVPRNVNVVQDTITPHQQIGRFFGAKRDIDTLRRARNIEGLIRHSPIRRRTRA